MADAVRRGIFAPIDDDTAADFYELAMTMLAERVDSLRDRELGFVADMVSHHIIYWRNGDTPGSAPVLTAICETAMMSQPSPGRYIAAVDRKNPL